MSADTRLSEERRPGPKPKSDHERFMAYVRTDSETGCWDWTGPMPKDGYGRFSTKRYGSWRSALAHRISYELFIGEIPVDLQLDHLCRNRGCVNPEHLEPVTNVENMLRGTTNATKTHCKWGHEFTPENTYVRPDGERRCRACGRYRNDKARGKL